MGGEGSQDFLMGLSAWPGGDTPPQALCTPGNPGSAVQLHSTVGGQGAVYVCQTRLKVSSLSPRICLAFQEFQDWEFLPFLVPC